jgi:hypothetical protein
MYYSGWGLRQKIVGKRQLGFGGWPLKFLRSAFFEFAGAREMKVFWNSAQQPNADCQYQ